jgi:hypothetical protein
MSGASTGNSLFIVDLNNRLQVVGATTAIGAGTGVLSSLVQGLVLTFDDIANVPVANPVSVSDWNTFFYLPTYGGVFTSVTVDGNVVKLFGDSEITIESFGVVGGATINRTILISVHDHSEYIVAKESYAFNSNDNLTSYILPNLVSARQSSFDYNPSLTNFYVP